jgi:polysaccharide biosynthesis/export protein
MDGSASAGYLRDMHTLFDGGTFSGLSDRQLLQRFAGEQGSSAEAAFEALVLRHGPMVMRVCRNALAHEQAEIHDAFQATFLVLVRKCRSIRRLDSVGSWLFGVATRVARRARVDAARRRSAELQGGLRIAATADHGNDSNDIQDLGPLLQAEVERLPDRLRAVVILCYWEGLTHEQAAARLGCPLGTVRSRVARARGLLHRRLSRRGLEPVAGVMLAAFDSPAFLKTSALEIPGSLVSSTVEIAKHVAARASIAQVTSPSIASLVQNVIGSMFMTKVKMIVACLLLIGAGAYGLALAAPQAQRARRAAPASDAPRRPAAVKSKAQPPLRVMSEYVVEPPDLLLVEVLEALPGRPISGERLVRPDGKISLGWFGDVYVAGLTVPQVKEKIVLHLRKYMADSALGLAVEDKTDDEAAVPPAPPQRANSFGESPTPPSTSEKGKPGGPLSPVPSGEQKNRVEPRDTDRVFVEVTASNSKVYYTLGEMSMPGRLPITGRERILDAINLVGGLTPEADHDQVFLYRQPADGGAVETLKIDIDGIMLGDDLSTNYQLQPSDRLVVRKRENPNREQEGAAPRPWTTASRPIGEQLHFNRGTDTLDKPGGRDARRQDSRAENAALLRLERRMTELEQKLDRKPDLILEAIGKPAE